MSGNTWNTGISHMLARAVYIAFMKESHSTPGNSHLGWALGLASQGKRTKICKRMDASHIHVD